MALLRLTILGAASLRDSSMLGSSMRSCDNGMFLSPCRTRHVAFKQHRVHALCMAMGLSDSFNDSQAHKNRERDQPGAAAPPPGSDGAGQQPEQAATWTICRMLCVSFATFFSGVTAGKFPVSHIMCVFLDI